MTEPVLVKAPPTTVAGDSWTKQIAGQYYRIATIECWIAHSIQKARVLTTDTAAIVPGVGATVQVDISASYTNHTLTVNDTAANGVGCVPLHYLAKLGAGDFNILLAITGFMIAQT